MTGRRLGVLFATALLLVASAPPLTGQAPPAPTAAVDQAPPKNLRPLLAPRQSEMRLVVQRYTLDRATLAGNFAGARAGRGGAAGGRGAAAAAPAAGEPVSVARIARLKRFDRDWQAALGTLDPATLTAPGRTDLDTL